MRELHYFFRLAGSTLFTGILLAAPWLYGGRPDGCQTILFIGITVSAVLALLTIWTTPPFQRETFALGRIAALSLPPLLAVALGFFQLLPLSAPSIEKFSPRIAELTAEFLPSPDSEESRLDGEIADENKSVAGVPAHFFSETVSVCPKETRTDLALLIASVLVLLSAGLFFRTPRAVRFLWLVLSLNGAALALFAIVTKAVPRLSFYQDIWPGATCGPFVNRNNIAGYLCLTLGLAISFLLREILRGIRSLQNRDEENIPEEYRRKRALSLRLADAFFAAMDATGKELIFWLVVTGILLSGTFITLSRGGSLAAAGTFLVAMAAFLFFRKPGAWIGVVGIVLLVSVALLYWVGMKEAVGERMETFITADSEENAVFNNGRLLNWKSAFQSLTEYRFRGSGYGTYGLAIRKNDYFLQIDHYCHRAENQYIEILLVGGVVGIVLFLAAHFLLGWTIFRSFRYRSERAPDVRETDADESSRPYGRRSRFGIPRFDENGPASRDEIFTLGIGMLAAFVGQITSGCFDYGLWVPANLFLFASMVGSFAAVVPPSKKGTSKQLENFSSDSASSPTSNSVGVVNRGPLGREKGKNRSVSISTSARPVFGWSVWLVAAILLLSIPAGYWGSRVVYQNWRAGILLRESKIDVAPEYLDLASIDRSIRLLTDAVERIPDDPILHRQLATAMTLRWQFLEYQRRQAATPGGDPTELWRASSPESLHWWIRLLERKGMKVGPRRLRNDETIRENIRPAMAHFLLARRLVPLYPNPHLAIGTLYPLTVEATDMDTLVQTCADRAMAASRYETAIYFHCGALFFLSGDRDRAFSLWRETLELPEKKSVSQKYLAMMFPFLVLDEKEAALRENFARVLPDNLELLEGAIRLYSEKSSPTVLQTLVERFGAALEKSPDKTSARYFRDRGCWNGWSGRPDEAFSDYQTALGKEPQNSSWNYEVGVLLLRRDDPRCVEYFKTAVLGNQRNKYYRQTLEKAEKKFPPKID